MVAAAGGESGFASGRARPPGGYGQSGGYGQDPYDQYGGDPYAQQGYYAQSPGYAPPTRYRRPRRGRRVLTTLLVLSLIACGLSAIGDRFAAAAAESKISEAVGNEVSARGFTMSGDARVHVAGFPFLAQAVQGRYDEVRIELHDLSGSGVTLPALVVTASGVHAPLDTVLNGTGQISADDMSGTVTVAYDSVSALINQPGLQVGESGGQLAFRAPLNLAGFTVTVVGRGTVAMSGGKLQVRVTELRPEQGNLPSTVTRLIDQYRDQWSVALPMPPLPFKLTLQSVTVLPEGLSATATAHAVTLSG